MYKYLLYKLFRPLYVLGEFNAKLIPIHHVRVTNLTSSLRILRREEVSIPPAIGYYCILA